MLGVKAMHHSKLQLARLQLELEYNVDSKGDLHLKEGSSQRARFIIYKLDDEYLLAFRHDVSPNIREAIFARPKSRLLEDHRLVRQILASDFSCTRLWYGTVLTFPKKPTLNSFLEVYRRGNRFVIFMNKRIVSSAWPARTNQKAAEGIVETLVAFQRQGFGSQVTSAWACSVLNAGKVPLYSYESYNVASRALARRLALIEIGLVAAYD